MARRLLNSEVAHVLKQLANKQGGRCGVCGLPPSRRDILVLDHNHDTGFIRGALHRSCNGAEGRIKSKAKLGHTGVSPEDYIIALGKYLERHKEPRVRLLHPSHLTPDEERIKRNNKARAARRKRLVKKV